MFEKISYTVLNKLNDTTDKKNSYSLFLIEHQRMRHITSEHLITVAVGYYFLVEGQHLTNLLQKSNISIHKSLIVIFFIVW